jgi:hypothetical protein
VIDKYLYLTKGELVALVNGRKYPKEVKKKRETGSKNGMGDTAGPAQTL